MARIPASVRAAYDLDSLTDVAVSVFSTRGYDATRMEHIANAANLSKSSLYHHVANKEQLLARALRRAVDALTAILDEPGATDGNPQDRLVYILRRTVEAELHFLPEVSLLLRVRGNTETERWALSRRRRYHDRVVELVREAQSAGEVRNDIGAALLVQLVLGMSNSLVDWYRPDGTWSPKAISDAIVGLLMGR